MDRVPNETSPPRFLHIALLLGLYVALSVFSWWLPTTPLGKWQREHLHWNYLFHTIFLALPLAVCLARPSRAALYGLTLSNWRKDLTLGWVLALPLLLFPPVVEAVFGQLTLKPHVSVRLGSTLLYQTVFVGVAEELLFRGFFQGEFNRALGKPFLFAQTRFGPGLLIVSLLFGLAHLDFNPYFPGRTLNWGLAAISTAFALLAGLVRERTGGLIAASLFHIGFGLYLVMFVVSPYGFAGIFLAWLSISLLLQKVWQDGPMESVTEGRTGK